MEILWKLTRVYKYRWKPFDRNRKCPKSWVLRNYAFLNVKVAQIVKIFEFKIFENQEREIFKKGKHSFLSKDHKNKKNDTYHSKNY